MLYLRVFKNSNGKNLKSCSNRVIDVIAEALKPIECSNAMNRAEQVAIAKCKRVGRYQMNYNRPISITFQQKEDKDLLMSNKQNLPSGIYTNDEYPIHVKQTRNRLRPILRLAKSLPDYRDNSKMVGDKLLNIWSKVRSG